MNNYRINNHYAKALMLFAQEQGVEDRVAEDMRLVSDVWAENRELNALFANPVIKGEKKVGIVKEIFDGKVSKETML